MRLILALLAAVLAVPAVAAAGAPSYEPGSPPKLCASDMFADQIGTNRAEAIEAAERPQRLWGLGGTDYLYGSATRASCLMGGRDADVLHLWLGGGGIWGEHGSDQLSGSPLDDVLEGGEGNDDITAGAGDDHIDGGAGADGIDAGAGDDRVFSRDGRGEVVRCGEGEDVAKADRVDVLLGCETPELAGRSPLRLVPSPRAAQRSAIVRFRMRVPEAGRAGAYRVLLVNACSGGPAILTRFPEGARRVRRGQLVRVGVRPPRGEWCPGPVKAAVLVHRRCASSRGCATKPPPEAVARLEFLSR